MSCELFLASCCQSHRRFFSIFSTVESGVSYCTQVSSVYVIDVERLYALDDAVDSRQPRDSRLETVTEVTEQIIFTVLKIEKLVTDLGPGTRRPTFTMHGCLE